MELNLLNASFKAADDISDLSLLEIEQRLSAEITRPTGFSSVILNERLVIHFLSVQDEVPTVTASVSVDSDFTVSLSSRGQQVPASQYKDIVSCKLKAMSQLINLMARVKAWAEEPETNSVDFFIQTAVKNLESAREKSTEEDDSDETSKAISFLTEQLQLLSVNKHGRHYSPDLLVQAYLIQSTSPAAYRVLLEQGTLILPSVQTLKKITRRLNGVDGLDNSSYLRLRASKLNELQRSVILMVDEIYVAKRVEYSGGQQTGNWFDC
jgi:hypothetical protein